MSIGAIRSASKIRGDAMEGKREELPCIEHLGERSPRNTAVAPNDKSATVPVGPPAPPRAAEAFPPLGKMRAKQADPFLRIARLCACEFYIGENRLFWAPPPSHPLPSPLPFPRKRPGPKPTHPKNDKALTKARRSLKTAQPGHWGWSVDSPCALASIGLRGKQRIYRPY